MYPIILQIGPLKVYSYGLMIAIAFLVCIFLARKEARHYNLDPDKIYDLSFFVLVSGIIGGRILYVILNLPYYLENPKEIIMLHHGGLVWFGAFGFALIGGIVFLKKNSLPIFKTLDFLAPYIALGHAIGRIGCFLNGCCYGRPAIWGVYFPIHQDKLIPIQLFESVFLLILFFILINFRKHNHKTGMTFSLYVASYSLWRFAIEFLRADTPRHFFGLTIFQIISIVLFFGSLYAILYLKSRR
ncbi:MAG: prolipoprotein diacylglyceryl transferase [Candidatus Omnitrophica bacterium]|nr:prolipoprotein diacylglyceryl transferase [Candidatus Omnitrophota bacterium]